MLSDMAVATERLSSIKLRLCRCAREAVDLSVSVRVPEDFAAGARRHATTAARATPNRAGGANGR